MTMGEVFCGKISPISETVILPAVREGAVKMERGLVCLL